MRLPFLLVTLALSVGRSRAQGVSAAVSASFSASQVEAAFTDAGTQVASASVPGGTTVGAPSAAIPSPAPSASASATDGGPAPTPAFFYPQPPLPSVSATRNSNAWTLSPDWEITDVPTTREYTFDIDKAAAAPDGFPRQIYAVNNQFPGPLIEANEGDEIVVHVNNHLDIPASIHWHGMFQNGTQFMDGPPGVSQCPIAPGGSFTYRFSVPNQYGSYWWHSHFANTLADGITGALIIHSTREEIKRGRDYDAEVVVMVQDWMDLQSQTVVEALFTDAGFRGSPASPQGDAILINGLGATNCSGPNIPDLSLPCNPPPPAEIEVPVGKRVRVRLLNTGSFGMFRVSIDQHPFELVEADDTAVWGPSGLHEVSVSTAQRASIIINTDQGDVGSGYFLRARFVEACLGPFALPQVALGVLRYVDEKGNCWNQQTPSSQPWDDLAAGGGLCQDTSLEFDLSPRDPQDAPTDILETYVMSSAAGIFVDKNGVRLGNFGINNVTYRNQIGFPLIQQVQEGLQIDGDLVAHATFHEQGGGDIVINNLDAPISHPFHLHGKPFMIVARGQGNITKEQWEGIQSFTANTTNPLRRDVLQIPGGTWVVLRLYIDLPGVWPLHCHIGWHLSEGKLAAFVYLPEKVKQIDKPEDWRRLCDAFNRDDFGPARRALPPPSAGKQSPQRRRVARKGPREA